MVVALIVANLIDSQARAALDRINLTMRASVQKRGYSETMSASIFNLPVADKPTLILNRLAILPVVVLGLESGVEHYVALMAFAITALSLLYSAKVVPQSDWDRWAAGADGDQTIS